jgi:hypothetical protein
MPAGAKPSGHEKDLGFRDRWLQRRDLRPPVLKQAAQLFKDGLSVREVAGTLRVSKTEAGRLRLRAVADGLLVYGHGDDRAGRMVTIRHHGSPPISFSPIQG